MKNSYFLYYFLIGILFASCSKEHLSGIDPQPQLNFDTELVSIGSDGTSFSPVFAGRIVTRSAFSSLNEEQSSYSLRVKDDSSLRLLTNNDIEQDGEYSYLLSDELRKTYPYFISMLDIYKEAMTWSDKYLDETKESYETWKKLYGDYLYFPEYKEDYGAYLPISDLSIAAVANAEGKVVIGDKVIDMRDIFTYKDLQEKGKDAYYSLSTEHEEVMTKASWDPCRYHYQLAGHLHNCVDEYDSDWVYKNNRKLRVKVGRQCGGNGVRIHVEISFRKKTIFGWGNYSSVTDSDFTYRGTTHKFHKHADSSHDFYINDSPRNHENFPPVPVPFCSTPTSSVMWIRTYIDPQPWSISIAFRGFGDDNYRVNRSSIIPKMYFYRPL